MKPSEYCKATVGALVAGLSVLAGAVGDGVSAQEWITTAVAALGGLGLIYAVPNRAPVGERADPRISEQHGDAGQVDVLYVLLVVLVVVVLLVVLGVL